MEVFAGIRVPRLQLVEPSGKPLGTTRNCAVWPLALRHSVFLLGGPASSPLPCLCPLLLSDLPLDVGEGSGERCWALLRPVRVGPPLHAVSVRLIRCELRPLIRLLVSFHPLVCRAPPDFDGDVWRCVPEGADVLLRFPGV